MHYENIIMHYATNFEGGLNVFLVFLKDKLWEPPSSSDIGTPGVLLERTSYPKINAK